VVAHTSSLAPKIGRNKVKFAYRSLSAASAHARKSRPFVRV
jgi:hypothetical protein